MKSRYYAAVATMAAHSDRSDLRAKALRRLIEAVGDGVPAAKRGHYLHDGERIICADAGATLLLGRRAAGRRVLSLLAPEWHATCAQRLAVLRSGGANAPWTGPLIRSDGRLSHVRAQVCSTLHEGVPAFRVELVDMAGLARLD